MKERQEAVVEQKKGEEADCCCRACEIGRWPWLSQKGKERAFLFGRPV